MAQPFPQTPTLAQVLAAGNDAGVQNILNTGLIHVASGPHDVAAPAVATDSLSGNTTQNVQCGMILNFGEGDGIATLGFFDVRASLLGGSPTSQTPSNYLAVTNGATTYFIPLLPST